MLGACVKALLKSPHSSSGKPFVKEAGIVIVGEFYYSNYDIKPTQEKRPAEPRFDLLLSSGVMFSGRN